MRAQSVELFLDVGLCRKQKSFLVKPLWVQPSTSLSKARDLLGEPRAKRFGLARGGV